jgi:3-oxoacyl-[acyl-carrier protein] reductase
VPKNPVIHVDTKAVPESDDPFYSDLRLFIGSGSLERVALLLDSGAGINSSDTNGLTPLMWAAIGGEAPMIRFLIERGVEVNAACNYGKTALMRAASYGRTEAVRLLLEHGADVHAKTEQGSTALDFTRGALHPEDAELELRKAGAIERAKETRMLLENKVALVTGAGRGIGSVIARRFAAEGAKVVVHYRGSREAAEALAREIGGLALGADLTDGLATEAMVADVLSHFGRIDILVNNAASFAADLDFEKATWDDFRAEFDGVVGATVNPTKAVVPGMKQQGKGRIINFVATLVQRPAPEYIVHTTAKSALIGLTRTLARDLGPHGITVNMVSPGMTLTEYSKSLPQELQARVAGQTPLRRLATAEDVANVVLFYASPLADFVTGANLAPDGGLAVL